MSAFRLCIGPVTGPLGSVFEVIEISPQGDLIRAVGDTVAEAVQRLEGLESVSFEWCAPPRVLELIGADRGRQGTPDTVQFAAAIRHILPLYDPASQLACEPDGLVHALFTAFAKLWAQGSGLRAGTSRPFMFEIPELLNSPGYAVLSASETATTLVVLGQAEDVRALYEAGFSADPAEAVINMIGFTLQSGPDWALDVVQDLTGQRVCPRVFVRLNGAEETFGHIAAQVCSILAACWPEDPESSTPTEAFYALPTGAGEVVLTPFTP